MGDAADSIVLAVSASPALSGKLSLLQSSVWMLPKMHAVHLLLQPLLLKFLPAPQRVQLPLHFPPPGTNVPMHQKPPWALGRAVLDPTPQQ